MNKPTRLYLFILKFVRHAFSLFFPLFFPRSNPTTRIFCSFRISSFTPLSTQTIWFARTNIRNQEQAGSMVCRADEMKSKLWCHFKFTLATWRFLSCLCYFKLNCFWFRLVVGTIKANCSSSVSDNTSITSFWISKYLKLIYLENKSKCSPVPHPSKSLLCFESLIKFAQHI